VLDELMGLLDLSNNIDNYSVYLLSDFTL